MESYLVNTYIQKEKCDKCTFEKRKLFSIFFRQKKVSLKNDLCTWKMFDMQNFYFESNLFIRKFYLFFSEKLFKKYFC